MNTINKVWNKKWGIGWMSLAILAASVTTFLISVVTGNNIIFALSWLLGLALVLILLGKFVGWLWRGLQKDT